MSGAGKVDPYSPLSSIIAGSGMEYADVVLSGAGVVKLLNADPHRLWFVVLAGNTNMKIAPWSDPSVFGWQPTLSQTNETVLFHGASYPGAIILDWWLYAGVPAAARVVWFSTKDT